jgi:hypothetical protein
LEFLELALWRSKQGQRQDYCHNLFAGNRYHFGFRDLRGLAYVDPMALFSNALSAYQNSRCIGRTACDLSDPICMAARATLLQLHNGRTF